MFYTIQFSLIKIWDRTAILEAPATKIAVKVLNFYKIAKIEFQIRSTVLILYVIYRARGENYMLLPATFRVQMNEQLFSDLLTQEAATRLATTLNKPLIFDLEVNNTKSAKWIAIDAEVYKVNHLHALLNTPTNIDVKYTYISSKNIVDGKEITIEELKLKIPDLQYQTENVDAPVIPIFKSSLPEDTKNTRLLVAILNVIDPKIMNDTILWRLCVLNLLTLFPNQKDLIIKASEKWEGWDDKTENLIRQMTPLKKPSFSALILKNVRKSCLYFPKNCRLEDKIEDCSWTEDKIAQFLEKALQEKKGSPEIDTPKWVYGEHEYFLKKELRVSIEIEAKKRKLARIPIYIQNEISGYQFIDTDGKKKFPPKTKLGTVLVDKGRCWDENHVYDYDHVYLSEGIADAFAFSQDFNVPVLCCFGAAKIKAAVCLCLAGCTQVTCIVDDDFRPNKKNVGLETVFEIARQSSLVRVWIPPIIDDQRKKKRLLRCAEKNG